MSQMANEMLLNGQQISAKIDQKRRREHVINQLIKIFLPNAQENLNLFLKDKQLNRSIGHVVNVSTDFLTVDYIALSTMRRGTPLITSNQRDIIRTYMLGDFSEYMNKLYMKTFHANIMHASSCCSDTKMIRVRTCERYRTQEAHYNYKWGVHLSY